MQRRKEEASDYRYFPEPDLVPVVVDAAWLERTRGGLGELPAAQRQRLKADFGLSAYDAGVLTNQGRAVVEYFEAVASKSGDAKAAANWVINKCLQWFKVQQFAGAGPLPITASNLAELISTQKSGLTKHVAEQLFDVMLQEGLSVKDAMTKLGIKAGVSEEELLGIVRKAIAGNPKAVADFKKGKAAAAQAIKGSIMRETKGTVKPDLVQQLLQQELEKV